MTSSVFAVFLHNHLSLCLLQILVLNTNTQELVASFRVTTGTSNTTAIKSIEFARKGRWEATGFSNRFHVDGRRDSYYSVYTGSTEESKETLKASKAPAGKAELILCFLFTRLLLYLLFCPPVLFSVQLFPHKHSRPDHQGVWWQGDTNLWPRRWAWTHAETTGPGQQVCQHRTALCPWGRKWYCLFELGW